MSTPDQYPGFTTVNISHAMDAAEFNDAGIAMTTLAEYKIGGVAVESLLVSLEPGSAVGVHLHERGGESQTALTPVRGIFGIPRLTQDGTFEKADDGHIDFEVIENRIFTPDEITSIPAGLVHGYGNPSRHDRAHIMFNLPRTHAKAQDKLLASSEEIYLRDTVSPKVYHALAQENPAFKLDDQSFYNSPLHLTDLDSF